MFRLNKNFMIVAGGIIALIVILLIVLISHSTKKVNPESNKLSSKSTA